MTFPNAGGCTGRRIGASFPESQVSAGVFIIFKIRLQDLIFGDGQIMRASRLALKSLKSKRFISR